MKQEEKNHGLLFYHELCRLYKFSTYYESTMDSIREEFLYIANGKSEIFSSNSTFLFKKFLEKIEHYYSSTSYAISPVFKFYDKNYLSIIKKDLLPLRESIAEDLILKNIEFDKCTVMEIEKPSDDLLILSIEQLYK